jgi:ectoine hydroxylase-related dioxygenase (phytanoyl-CoA dioxygenase family)
MSETLSACGSALDTSPAVFGELVDSSPDAIQGTILRGRLDRDGYLFFRSVIPRPDVLAARAALLETLRDAGGLDPARPMDDAVPSTKRHLYDIDQPTPWWTRLTATPAYRRMCHHPAMLTVMGTILGADVRVLAYYALRFMPPRSGTAPHADRVYFHGTKDLLTAWIPIGDTPRKRSTLMVLEGSHRDESLRSEYSDHFGRGMISNDVAGLQRRFGGRWLTTDFAAGDVLIFGMYTLHCSLDNRDGDGRMRISTDVRYQRANEPIDPRFEGDGTWSQAFDLSWKRGATA